jgi:energy coupling factor transporter S component ThiW
MLVAIGVALAPFTSFPIGIAKINPTQHFVNVLGAVLLGPGWAVLIAAVIGVIRNVMGVGTLLAFPGGMIGAFLAGLAYRWFRRAGLAALGEMVGTGVLAPVVSALVVAPFLMNTSIPLLALVPSFLGSTVIGALLGVMAIRLLHKADII